MSNFGHVEKVTCEVGGRVITFRSKGEYRWCVWCELRREQGIVVGWEYESEVVPVKTKLGEIKFYRPDFTIEYDDRFEFEEFKGWFQAKDYTKMKLMAEQYDNPLTLIFANLTNCKSNRLIYGRAKGLEKLLESNGGRIIFDANKTIFSKIKHLFEL